MILSYLNLVGSASAKEIFYHCVGTLIKREEMRHQAEVNKVWNHNSKGANAPSGYEYLEASTPRDPVAVRTEITESLIRELELLMEEKLISKSTNAVGQFFYRVK